jgi:hypothetical protein
VHQVGRKNIIMIIFRLNIAFLFKVMNIYVFRLVTVENENDFQLKLMV